jgi:outer membrane autotransporter protein
VGARLRVDWLDALALSKAKLTPYSSLTYMRTRTDGYREQGGAFPVIWNQRIDKATTARLGLDALYPLSEKTLLQGRVEAAHRFEKTGAATSGQIVGLNGFGFSGQNIKRDWLRFSAGVESKMGRGIASVMLNTTTQGEAPTYWMAASYRWEL